MHYHFVKCGLLQDQLIRRAHFHYPSSLHHDDVIIIGNRDQPVSDGYDGGVFEFALQHRLNEIVGFHVHIRRCFVQDQDIVLAQKGSS